MNRRNFLSYLIFASLAGISPIVIAKAIASKHNNLANNSQFLEPDRLDGEINTNAGKIAARTAEISFYVSPKGNDRWTGKQPERQGNNGPFATLARARDAIRQLKQQQGGKLQQPVTVYLRGGTYFLPETLTFTDRDSGSKGMPIVYRAYRQERPIISGGRIVKGWKKTTINGKTAWTINIPTITQGQELFHQMWVNGTRARRCRYPKQGYLKVAATPGVTPQSPIYPGQNSFKFRNGDLKAWPNFDRGEAVVMSFWLESRLPIQQIDPATNTISFKYRSFVRLDPGHTNSSGAGVYYLENIRDFLTEPGEWYIDSKSGRVDYLPKAGERIENSTIIIPRLSKLVEINPEKATGRFVEYLNFENLTFAHAEWYYAPTDAKRSLEQAALTDRSGAIYLHKVRSCAWKQCTMAHLSNYALYFANDCFNNQVVGCNLFDLGSGGIKIERSSGNQIVGCHIYNGGSIFHSAVGIWLGIGDRNLIARNHIHDFYNSGISIGTIDNKALNTTNNLIEFNHIHHIGKRSDGTPPLLNDKGGIYTLAPQPGTKIRANLIHDIQSYNFGGWGIYLDESTSEITIEDNIVYRTRNGGFHLHNSNRNIVQNNIFANNNLGQLERNIKDTMRLSTSSPSFKFQRNIIYWQSGNLLAGQWDDDRYEIDRNLYWQVNNKSPRFGTKSWREWQQSGRDRHSRIADPLFVDPAKGNFRLRANSPAAEIGFKSLDYVYRNVPGIAK